MADAASRPEKILCITNDFGPRAGGIETFIAGLLERTPYGSVLVYTSAQENSEPYDQAWLENFGVEVVRDSQKVLLPSIRVSRAVNKIVREQEIQTVFFGAAAPLGLLAWSLRRNSVKRIIALTHGHEVWWSKIWPFSWALRFIGNNCDHLTYLGEFTRSEISKSLSKKAAQSMLKIAPGIDTEHFAPLVNREETRTELNISEKKVILHVGRLVHRKGQDILLEALPEVLRKHPDAHVLLIGQGPYKKHLEKLVSKYQLSNFVTFIGRVQYAELPRYFSAGDIFVAPSRSRFGGLEVEGLGIVYLEASACGLPVIAGKSGGAPDAVVEGVTGITVDGTDAIQVSREIIRLLDNPVKAREMGIAGRKWIIENWRWEIWASEFTSLLRPDQRP